MAHATTMVVKVDLQCHESYKKIKKVLCSFYEIQDQVYDEKENKVTIKVVCCDPERMKQRILCKGKCVIQCIEIPKEKPKPEASTSTSTPPPPPPAATVLIVPFVPWVPVCPVPVPGPCCRRTCCQECSQGRSGGPCFRRTCCQECDEGCSGGPCSHGRP